MIIQQLEGSSFHSEKEKGFKTDVAAAAAAEEESRYEKSGRIPMNQHQHRHRGVERPPSRTDFLISFFSFLFLSLHLIIECIKDRTDFCL